MAASGKIHDSPPGSAPRLGHSTPAGAIVDLRKLLAERFPNVPVSAATRLATGLSFLDQAIGGGLPKGAITELTTPQIIAGSASLIQSLLQVANRDHFCLALICCRDSLDAQTLVTAS